MQVNRLERNVSRKDDEVSRLKDLRQTEHNYNDLHFENRHLRDRVKLLEKELQENRGQKRGRKGIAKTSRKVAVFGKEGTGKQQSSERERTCYAEKEANEGRHQGEGRD